MQGRRIVIVLVIAVVLLAGAYACFPPLRLWTRASALKQASNAQWVDAHRYDPEWFDAARAGRVDILRLLHDAHYPIDARSGSGYTALVLAAYDEQPEALDYLLRAGANACIADHNGNTALMGAIYKGHTDIARRLLHAGCPIDQANNAGETALAFAALFGRNDLLADLAHAGARLDSRDAQGQTPMAMAVKQGNQDMAAALRQLGARD
ncbi:ankyrin repeat domain-containing protein [Dyella nitratireducens]|uniref:Ankyrin repeat domain-containing protein n=1 Tax=Dyella nitratireducens TaxID=1849580 RepID=A0ABQ1FP20_9GAMM|nr:ankyrin repeat domain-containing protein [Dyella nitratireducens]GGA24537.1 hypothetical protein GCM10010981_11280 [Dyella nitratireducens]GLQ43809.1 hypothetical protein GCM10007902_36590 [Dyella nitratireducens]